MAVISLLHEIVARILLVMASLKVQSSVSTAHLSVVLTVSASEMLVLLIAFAATVNGIEDRVCYSDLGCFSMKEPWLSWNRPCPPPDPPKAMKIRALFFNRDSNPDDLHVVTTWPKINLNGAAFDGKKITYFIIHGFETLGTDEWLMEMKSGLLKRVDANVFIGDWGRGAKGVSYFQAAGNLRLAARQFSNLIHYLIDQRSLNVSKLHLIGHSLGAQTGGYIGKSIPGIWRITAMDTAQPLFEGFGTRVKLVRTDARHVDTIHADARPFIPDLGFGFMNPVGDIDYYLNGGHDQPGCSFPKLENLPKIKSVSDFVGIPMELLRQILLCPHGMSHDFFNEAISNPDCIFWGHNATMKNMLQGISNAASEGFFSKYLASSSGCTYETCSPMGLDSFDWPARGAFVINTRGSSPYCIYEPAVVSKDEQNKFIFKVQKTIYKSLLYRQPVG